MKGSIEGPSMMRIEEMRGAEGRLLLRLLAGELDDEGAAALRRRLDSEPELGEAYRLLEGVWNALEPPPATGVPEGFAARVKSAAEARSRREVRWSSAPAWARTGGLAALGAGVLLGVALARPPPPPERPPLAQEIEGAESLAESYWHVLERAEGEP